MGITEQITNNFKGMLILILFLGLTEYFSAGLNSRYGWLEAELGEMPIVLKYLNM